MNPALKCGACNCRFSVGCDSPTRRYNRLHDISPSNIASSVKVGISRVAAQATFKLRLALAVGFLAVPARRRGARRVASVNQTKRHAVTNGAILHKFPELVEAPTVVLSPTLTLKLRTLRLSQPYPVTNATQIFELQFSAGAFSRLDEVLCNLVVGITPKTRFFTRNFLQPTLSRTSAALLQARTVALKLLALVLNLCPRKRFAVGGGGNLSDTKVYAERTRRFLGRFVSKLALQVDVPLALLPSDKLPALNGERGAQEVPLIPADFEWDREPTINGGQGDSFVLDLDREDALVIVNGRGLETPCSLALALPDSSYSPHRKVGTKPKLSPDVLIRQLLEVVLVKTLRFPGNSQDVVTRRCKSINRPAQTLGLTRLGYQFATHAQEGHSCAWYITRSVSSEVARHSSPV
jgi:hypothetical protein